MSGKPLSWIAAAASLALSTVPAFAFDLTAVWQANDCGSYSIRQVGNEIWWYGSANSGEACNSYFENAAHGTISGNNVFLRWADLPRSTYHNQGILELQVVTTTPSLQLRALRKTGGFGASVWVHP